MQNMPKSFKRSNTLVQLQYEVEQLEKTLVEHIRSKKQNMTSSTPSVTQTVNTQLRQTPVAIVGMASIFPQAKNLQEYWQKIVTKTDCITNVPPSRWNVEDYYDPNPTAPDKTYCKRGGFIPEIDFNPMEFGIPPNQLEVTDISQLLALVVAKEALKDAGYGDDKPFDKEHTGVILGVALARQLTMPLAARLEYPVWEKALKSSGISEGDTEKIINKIKNAYVDWEPNAFPGMLANIVSGRIANRFDLGGMNCIVDAACASSLGALSMAISELTSGRANMMLSGGVDTDNSIMAYMCFSKTPAVSPTGTTKPFDVDSDGMMLGEGVGMLVLKRLEDAERDNNRIYAVIKGIGTSSDGRHKSIYAPRPEGQMKALRRAYDEAGFTPDTVGMIEAHGTGTMAGDPAEFSALKGVFGEDNDSGQIALGSVKSQIGHTKAAAGAASLIKTALALHHKILPATINVTQPHPKLGIEDSPFYLNTETRPWLQSAVPRRAGVSSFGFGGTNYHVVLEEHESQQQYRLHDTPQSILIAAPTPKELVDRCQEILQKLQSAEGKNYFSELGEASKTLEIPVSNARLGFVATDVAEAINKLQKGTNFLQQSVSDWNHPLGIFYRQTGLETGGKVVALFSGQGSQYLEMGREIAMNFPCLQDTYNQIDGLFEQDELKPSKIVFPPPVFDEEQRQEQNKALQRTEIAQGAIAAFSTGLYKILQQAGFKPDFVAGHSFGELTALWAAGVLSDRDYFFLVKERGQAMATPSNEDNTGAMLAVKGDVTKIEALIKDLEQIEIANRNSPQQIVLAGNKAAILQAQKVLENQGYSAVLLQVSAAFHTEKVAHAQAPFAHAVEAVTFNSPQIPVFTNTTAGVYPENPSECQKILKQHLLSQVLFQKEIENIYAAGGTCFIEFGPRSILTYLVKETLGDRAYVAVALNPSRQKDSDYQLREAVLQLRVAGLDLSNFDPYQTTQPTEEKRHPISVGLNSVNYVSEKNKKALEEVFKQEPEAIKPQTSAVPDKVKIADRENNAIAIAPKSQQNGHSKPPDTINEVAMTSISTNKSQSKSTEIPLDRILSSLEYSLSQFHMSQQETLEVHKQYLQYQAQYTQTFFGLMQQQSGLWTNLQNSPHDIEVKTSILQSAERSLTKFQEHQDNTLRVHEQYLNHQAQYAQNFFLLTQASYSQLLNGNLDFSFERNIEENALPSSEYYTEDNIVATEFVTAQVASVPEARSNGHHSPAEVIAKSSNGHHQAEEIVAKNSSNGHHYEAFSPTPDAIKTNGHHVEVESPVIDDSDLVKPTDTATPVPEIDFATLSKTLLHVVSDKTGYPPEMLELDMDMEADLGIDSIKRVEILGGLQEQIPSLPQPDLEDLSQLRTLNQIIEYLRSFKGEKDSSTTNNSVAAESLEKTFLSVVSQVTGYPVSSLNSEMNLQSDLGIDSVRRKEIFDSLQKQVPTVEVDSQYWVTADMKIAEVIDYLNDPQKKKLKAKMSLSSS